MEQKWQKPIDEEQNNVFDINGKIKEYWAEFRNITKQ